MHVGAMQTPMSETTVNQDANHVTETPVFTIREENRFKLDPNFIIQFIGQQPKWGFGLLSYVTYKRTYARRLDKAQLAREAMEYLGLSAEAAGRHAASATQESEEYWQTCVRVVEGVSSIYKQFIRDSGQNWSDAVEQEHAQAMFQRMWDLKFTPPGRGLWGMGTSAMELKGSAMLNNCFVGAETFITREHGVVRFDKVVGSAVTVLTPDGWRPATVAAFGEQQVQDVTFAPADFATRNGTARMSRSNLRTRIRVTPNHRWLTLNRGEVTDLQVGDTVMAQVNRDPAETLAYREGRIHGLIFGDGTAGYEHVTANTRAYHIRLCGEKARGEVSRFDNVTYPPSYNGDPYCHVTSGRDLKQFPEDGSPDYLRGFLDGWIVADGSAKPSAETFRLASQHPDAEAWLRQNAATAGWLLTGLATDKANTTNFGPRTHPLTAYSLTRQPRAWVVTQIEVLADPESVFCAQVPDTRSFTLAAGIHTGNCGFCSTQHLATDFTSPFERLMDFSMLGVGMGFDVLGAGTVTLQEPEIDYTPFTIPDTREGWVHAVKLTLGAFVGYNALPREWDYSQIRPEGAPLRTFGGTASGHGPLKRLLDTLYAICRSYVGRFIDDAFIVDVMNVIGVCVVAGNVRRSSEIALGSPKSESFLRLKDSTKVRELSTKIAEVAKTIPGFKELADDYFALYQQTETMSAVDPRRVAAQQDLMGISARMKALTATNPEHVALEAELYAQPLYTHRWASNNTVLCEIGNTDYDAMAEQTLLNGEPGYGWLEVIRQYGRLKDPPNNKDRKAMGFNPCQPSEALVLTPDGIRTFGDIDVGSTVWSGQQWTRVIAKQATGTKAVYRYRTAAGSFLGTENHRVVSNGTKVEVRDAEAIDIALGNTASSRVATHDVQAVVDGLVLGDGYYHHGRIKLLQGAQDSSYAESEIATYLGSTYRRPDTGIAVREVRTTLTHLLKTYEREIPDEYFKASSQVAASFLRGLYSANGSVVRTRITLKAASRRVIDQAQAMLSSLGISTYVTTNAAHDVEFDNGSYTCRESYDLNIGTREGREAFRKSVGFIQPYKQAKLDQICDAPVSQFDNGGKGKRTYPVTSVELIGEMPVFDITVEAEEHTYWSNGLLVSNCGEQSLHDGELCCVSGDTRIQTRTGSPKIADVVGQKVQVWNGDRWSEVTPFVAASGKKLFRVYLSDGSYLDCTDDHGWHVRPDGKRVFRRVDTKDLPLGAQSQPYALGDVEGTHSPVAYEWGLFLGDGFMDRGPMLVLHGVKVDLLATGIQGTARKAQHPEGYAKPFVRVSMAGVLDEVRAETLRDSSQGLPDWIFALDTASIRELVAGWIDTDGHVNHQTNTDNYRVFGSEAKMRSLQLLLRRIGVNHASVYQMAAEGEATNYGERNYALWVCYIPSFECAGIPTRLKIAERFGSRYGVNNAYPNGKPIDRARKQTVVRVEELPGTHTTYCFSEPENHMGVFGNALTYQCLVESYPTRHETLEDFLETLKYAYRYAKAVTLIPTHDKKTNAVMVRNRRIGTSMAGIIEMYSKLGMRECKRWWDEGYKTICEWDTEYSSWLGVNESIKKTSLKPGGTTPLLVGVEGGMKAPTSAYYMRTIRIDHISPLLKPLRDAGYRMEPDLTTPRTMVVYFPVKAPQGVRSGKEISLWEQAEIFTALQAEWSDNMVSATLTFQDHERGDVARVLKNYEGRWKGVSFLPFSDHGFAQAPYIPCSKTEYENAVATLSPVTLDGNMISHDTDDKYCSGGLCETPVPSPELNAIAS